MNFLNFLCLCNVFVHDVFIKVHVFWKDVDKKVVYGHDIHNWPVKRQMQVVDNESISFSRDIYDFSYSWLYALCKDFEALSLILYVFYKDDNCNIDVICPCDNDFILS